MTPLRLDRIGRDAAVKVLAVLVLAAAQPAMAHLQDSFTRSDNAAVGNGWIEKNAGAFTLAGNRASKQTVGTGYADNLVYRPASEDVLNVEASVELQLTSATPGYPQIAVRVQSATVANAATLDGYLLYVDNSTTRIILGRQSGTAFVTTLATITPASGLNTTDRFRLRLRATGTNPVQLNAFVERLNGAIWDTIGQASFADAAANRFATAGSVGFGGYTENTYFFDNFTRVDIGATGTANPLPATDALSPTQATAGESGLTLTVYGSGFTTDSVVSWNGGTRATTYVSPSELTATITAADLATPGTASIAVANPTPGGGVSSPRSFTVADPGNPPPAITSLSPNTVVAGGAGFTLTVNGSGFNAGSQVRWAGSGRTTTFLSSTQLQAAILQADVASTGTVPVTVFRASDSTVSAASDFTVSPASGGDFTDAFTRADNAAVGNGWLEKFEGAFSIAANEASKSGAGFDYRDNVVYRPASENVLDAEASLELRFVSLSPGYPMVLVRGQTGTINASGTLDAYILYVNDSSTQAVLSRQRGGSYDTQLAFFTLNPALNTTDRYRLRLRATGTNPVALSAFVERLNGGTWQTIGTTTFNDADAQRLSSAGTVGFSGYIETNYRFDNFNRTMIGTNNPVPALGSIAPTSATAGGAGFTLTVNGSNFVAGSIVRWNGVDRATTFVSGSQLTAAIGAADIQSVGTAAVTVFNPAPGGGTTAAQTFTVNAASNPVPTATSLAPSAIVAGSSAFTLTVNGSNFVNGSIVRWNGANRTTTFVSPTQLTADITAADVQTQGTRTVTVFNPTPGGGTSGNLTFTVNATNPSPTATALVPSSATAGGGAFTLTVNGSNFVLGSSVRWNGANRTTTFVSASQLTAQIAAADIAAQGTANVSVFNPTPGGGTSGNLTFTINATNPVPVASSLSPAAAGQSSGAFTLTVNGSGFVNGSVVRWNGAARTTTFVSATQLTAAIPATDLSAQGTANVSVFNPTPGGGTSGNVTFTITAPNNPVPTATSLAPNSTPAGGVPFTLTVNGTNFVNGSVVRWNGSNRTTTFVSTTQLTAAISASDIGSQGTRTVTVFNPTPGGGTSGNLTFTVSPPSSSNPLPVLTSLSPQAWPTGGGALTLTVNGSGFVAGSVVHLNGLARTTTVISATQLQAQITATDVAVTSLPAITVVSPSPGGGRSTPLTLLVQDGSLNYFVDTFNRANNASVGNGWTEKNQNAFSLTNNEVTSFNTTDGFQNDIMYRPASEDRLNQELSVEFTRLANGSTLGTSNWPQLHGRVQSSTVAVPWTLDSYIFFIEDTAPSPRAMFAITVSPTLGSRFECYIQPIPLPGPLVTGDRYRLRFRLTGVSPVTLYGAVDRYANGAWTLLADRTITHDLNTQRDVSTYCDFGSASLPPPITSPGTAGIAKWTNRTDTYDNFFVRDASTPAPPATVSSLSPSSAVAGSGQFTLTVNGTGFTQDSTVRWNKSDRPTTFISSTQIRATISAADLASSGIATVTVVGNLAAESAQIAFNVAPATGTASFDDLFNRTSSATIGNGWIEKNAAAFSISNGRASKLPTTGSDYRNNLVYRPASEDRRDAEAVSEFVLRDTFIGYPQIMVRVQSSTVNTVNGFDGYMMFMQDSSTVAVLARQRLGGYETPLVEFNLSQGLVVNGTYRFRLSAVGAGSVNLNGTIERLLNGQWTVIGTASFVDNSSARIDGAGSVAFGGYVEGSYDFDNFRRHNLGTQ
jgi:hypothetical protein